MPYGNVKLDSFFVWDPHYSSAIGIEGDMTEISQRLLIGRCLKCNRKTSMTVIDKTIAAEIS